MREFGSDWSLAVDGDEILREFGSERDFVKGEKRKRKLEKEKIRDRESLEMRLKEKEKELRLNKI